MSLLNILLNVGLGFFLIWFMIFYVFYKFKINKKFKKVKLLDGHLPIIGHTLLIANRKLDTPENMYLTMKEITDNVNEDRRLWLMNHHFFGAASPDTIEKVLTSQDAVEKSYVYRASELIMPGIISCPGYKWRGLRKRLNTTFNPKFIPHYIDQINYQTSIFIKKISALQGDKYEDIMPFVSQYFFDIITSTHFGVNTKQQFKHQANMAEIAVKSTEFQFKWISKPWLQPNFIFKRSKLYGELKNVLSSYKIIMDKITLASEEYQRNIDQMEVNSGWKSYLVHCKEVLQELGIKPSLELIGITAADLIVAGSDTTTAALSTAIYHLGLHPEYQELALKEIKEVLGEDFTDETLNYNLDDVKSFGKIEGVESDWEFTPFFPPNYSRWTKNKFDRLQYCEMLIKEGIRLSSPSIIARYLTADVPVGDFTIPKGTNVLILMRCLHNNSKYYEKPDTFYPEHFTKENIKARPKMAFIPFSYGPRDCPGKSFGMYGMKCLLVELIRNFHIITKKPENPIVYKVHLMVEHSDGYPVKFVPRK